jgi:hypothetical protein
MTNTGTSIVVSGQQQPLQRQQLSMDTYTLITNIAPVLHKSGFFRTASIENCVATMIVGYELGFSLTGAFDNIDIILGRPSLKPKGALALILQARVLNEFKITEERDDQGNPFACRCLLGRRDQPVRFEARFTINDAIRAGLVKPDSAWENWRDYMLRWRAIGACADIVCPDVTAGLPIAVPQNVAELPDEDEFRKIASVEVIQT